MYPNETMQLMKLLVFSYGMTVREEGVAGEEGDIDEDG